MRLPWNKKYLIISFHVILTLSAMAVIGLLVFRFASAKNVVIKMARDVLAIFAPVFLALFFAVVLEPITAFYQRQYEKRLSARKKIAIQNRKAGTALTYISVLIILCAVGTWLGFGLGGMDMNGAADQLSAFIQKAGDLLVLLNLKLAELGVLKNVEGMLSAWIASATTWVQGKITGLAVGLPHMGGNLVNIAIGLVVAFYFLMEKDRILIFLKNVSLLFFGSTFTYRARRIFMEMNRIIIGYLGGQLTDALIMGTLFAIVFTFLKIPYGMLIGIVSGLSNLIPYFGAVTAFILAILSGLLSGEPVRALYAAIAIVILQQIDSIFIVPKVVGAKVELHPILVLLSLAVFGQIFGFWGLLVAVPLGAFMQSAFLWLCKKKLETLGHEDDFIS